MVKKVWPPSVVAWLKGHWQLLVLLAAVCLLWPTPILSHLKLLVVFMHELAHAVAVLLTGGEVVSFSVNSAQGGQVTARGGSRFLSLTAGYLGSLLFGVGLLLAALRSNADRWVLAGFGIAMILITMLYSRTSFSLAFGIGTGAIMLLAAYFLPHQISDLILRIIGMTSMIYVPYDIFSDTIARSHLSSDARMLAEEFGGTTMMWGGLWLLISGAVIFACLRYGLGKSSNLSFAKPNTATRPRQ